MTKYDIEFYENYENRIKENIPKIFNRTTDIVIQNDNCEISVVDTFKLLKKDVDELKLIVNSLNGTSKIDFSLMSNIEKRIDELFYSHRQEAFRQIEDLTNKSIVEMERKYQQMLKKLNEECYLYS